MTKILLAFLFAGAPAAVPKEPSWALLPFTKADKVNPVLTPGKGVFTDPIWRKTVADGFHFTRLAAPDLYHWTKHGPAFAKAQQGKYLDKWSKSGSIVSRYVNGRIIATRIQVKFWMYWGDQFIWAATSDPHLAEGTYTAAQVLLDSKDPTHILHRMDQYFMRPDKPYELTGQVNEVCFIEGLALFQHKWFLYYGTADSKIAVTTRPAE